ncbi:MAG: hypothetical protein Ct9H90mP25_2510 [Gammaproteobacteria bacterium]|nr:MAG: hypothetical protein Ct9H90mP25_2510 [Gammaproteobacteria bacterium]
MTLTTSTFPKPRILASVLGLSGIAMTYLGFLLLNVGGSAYFVVSGIALLTCSALLFLGNAKASPLYGIFLALTLLWSFYEVGLDAWALMPRVGMFFSSRNMVSITPCAKRTTSKRPAATAPKKRI